MSNIVVFPT